MSLALVALRLAAVAALNSHPSIAQLCAGRVYDSRIGDFNHREPVPVIVVTTEDLTGHSLSANNGGAPFRDEVDLVLEIAMNAVAGEGAEASIVAPVTDAELEAALNLLGWCAEQMLTLGRPTPLARPTAQGLILLKAVTRRVLKRHTSRFSTDQTGEKLAIHLVSFRVELKTETPDARSVPTGPFASLPDPLRTVAESLPAGSAGLLTCQMITAALNAPTSTILQMAAINPAGMPTPVSAGPVPSITIPLAESP